MGVFLLATLLSAPPLASSQPNAATTMAKLERTSGVRKLKPGLFAKRDGTTSTPIYDQEECDSWTSTLVANDENDSDGVSESEYHAFLSSIEDPPYISAYFEAYEGFNQLPWAFRVVHKTLACHCEKLGFGEECCEGDDTEILLQGLKSTSRNRVEEDYKDSFCQQIAYVLRQSIPSPAPTDGPTLSPTKSPSAVPSVTPTGGPTDGPTVSPTKSPSAAPTISPSMGPSAAPTGGPSAGSSTLPSMFPSMFPSAAPTGSPTVGPTKSPSAGPTASPSTGPTTAPTAVLPVAVRVDKITEPEKDDGLGIGVIIGVALACLALLVASVVARYRRANKQAEPRNLDQDGAGESDLGTPPMAVEEGDGDSSLHSV